MTGKGRRLTVDERIAMRDRLQEKQGHLAGWSDYALDLYLEGMEVKEILDAFNVSNHIFYNSIAKAALYRLMKERNCERMDEMEELTDVKA